MIPTFNANGSILTPAMLKHFMDDIVGRARIKRFRAHVLFAVHSDKTYLSFKDGPIGQSDWKLADLPLSRTLEDEGKLQALDGRGKIVGEIIGIGYPQ